MVVETLLYTLFLYLTLKHPIRIGYHSQARASYGSIPANVISIDYIIADT